MIALFFFMAASLSVVSLPAQAKRLCCVAGKYEGFQINYAKPNCPPPLKEKFTMVIKQVAPCTADVGGTITDSSGLVNNWTGTLSRGLLQTGGELSLARRQYGQIQWQYMPETRQMAGQGDLG